MSKKEEIPEKLKCNNQDCESNKKEKCEPCNGKGQNTRGQRCMDCNGKGFRIGDQIFILVTQEMSLNDFELDEDGNLGNNLTVDMREDNHWTSRIIEIRCRHCDNEIKIPESWKKAKELQRTDEQFAKDCRGDSNISIPLNIREDLEN